MCEVSFINRGDHKLLSLSHDVFKGGILDHVIPLATLHLCWSCVVGGRRFISVWNKSNIHCFSVCGRGAYNLRNFPKRTHVQQECGFARSVAGLGYRVNCRAAYTRSKKRKEIIFRKLVKAC